MKTVIVTGARAGLGLAICKNLAATGYKVVAVVRNVTCCQELENIENVFLEEFDLARVELLHDFVLGVTKKYGRIYGLVNNAAIGSDGVLATMHDSEISQVLSVNLLSPILLTKYVSRSMLLAGRGRVINISSIIASTGFSGLSVYAASKAGLVGFTKSLSRELGKARITVNCIAPGYMETNMTSGIQPEKLEAIKRRSPSGKLASVEAVADAVTFLLAESSDMINGTTLTIDGGSTA